MRMFAFMLMLGGWLLLIPLAADAGSAAKGHYIDGTIPNLAKGTEGSVHTDSAEEFVFEFKQGTIKIPYAKITKLEFGMKSHTSVGYNVLIGLHPKRVKDYALTIEYQDTSGTTQNGVFELSKDGVFVSLVNLQARTNKDVEFENKRACEYAKKNAPPGQMELDCAKLAK